MSYDFYNPLAYNPIYDRTVKYQYMELIEMTGWIALGFIPTYLALELYTRRLRHRKLTKLFSLIRYPKGAGVRI